MMERLILVFTPFYNKAKAHFAKEHILSILSETIDYMIPRMKGSQKSIR